MSRAFIKEPDGDSTMEELPDLPQSPHPNFVTPVGLRQLKERQDTLAAQLATAQNSTDLSERQDLPRIRRDLRYLRARIERAIMVSPKPTAPDEVCFGVRVEVEDAHGTRSTFAIVGEDEADAATGKVSWVSPLARALIGKSPGSVVLWRRPAGNMELKLIAIHPGTESPEAT